MSQLKLKTEDMVHDGAEVYNEAMHNYKTKIGKKYSTKDVLKVWDCISKWIENNTSQDKGVRIKGIGYFTVARWELNGNKKPPTMIRKPVFVIDEKLANDYNLKRTRPYNTGNIPERYLNVLTIAQTYQLNIDMVTHCLNEVIVAFKRLLYEEKNCELPFPKIGKLQINNKAVKMKYYQEFLDRQNQNMKNCIIEEKNKNRAMNYNPNWDVDQYESRVKPKRPSSAMSIISRPASSLSQYSPAIGYEGVLPNNDNITNRPSSRLSVNSICHYNDDYDYDESMMCRPGSRQSVNNLHKPTLVHSRPESSSSQQRPGTGNEGVFSNTGKLKENNHGIDKKNTLIFGRDRDENLCQSCNFREYRLKQINKIYKSDLSSKDNRDNFMKGDNPINGILSNETKRKDQLREISNYNYKTAKELINAIENEKKKSRKEKNNDSYILKKRPSSITNIEKRVNFKHSLQDQIKCNKIKKETEKMASLKCEKMMQNELLKSLYDERIRNIEARNRSKEDYLIILDEQLKNKTKITEEQKKKDKKIPPTKPFIFGPNQDKLQKLNNCKHRQIADYQLKQKNERNLELREQKEKNIDFEKTLLNQLKEKDETLQRNLLQKKLNQKQFLSEDLNKLLAMSKTERRKNEVPGSYPMSFPLKRTAKRCRICKKNGLGFPVEKITDFMC